jgi:hypothetical protein
MTSVSVQVGQNLAVTQGKVTFHTDLTSTFNNGSPTVTLGQPIEAGETYGEVKDETSTTMAVTQEAVNIFSALAGGGTSRSKNYTFVANPVKYKALSVKILKEANKTILTKAK